MQPSLFGQLANKFVTQTENLATESLNYILAKSPTALKSYNKVIRSFDNRIEQELTFRTQVTDKNDNAIPDIIGYNKNDEAICIIEIKFWAGLTSNQPVKYLERLPSKLPSILLFIAPEIRTPSLWIELLERLRNANVQFDDFDHIIESYKVARIDDYRSIGIVTWVGLLNTLKVSADAEGDFSVRSDIDQLRGLCESIDNNAFIPIRGEEISPNHARRNLDFAQLVDDLVTYGKQKTVISTKGLKSVGNINAYIRYVKIGEYYARISFSNNLWLEHANTPLWLLIYGKDYLDNNYGEYNRLKDKLTPLLVRKPKKLFEIDNNPPLIPLYLRLGVPHSQVIDDLMNQILEVMKILD
ncbi:MAG: hypothetical protein WD577_14580 [Bacteroidales bacterium]